MVLEFKSEPYRLQDDREKVELAKDASALANTSGGYIILGIKTKKLPDFNADIAFELRPIPRVQFVLEQYESVLRDWIYPPLNDARLTFIEDSENAGKGYLVIEISPELAQRKPYLVVRTLEAKNERERRILFGYSERYESRALSAIVQRLQQLLHLGLHFEKIESFHQSIEDRLSAIEGTLLKKATADEESSSGERFRDFEGRLSDAAIQAGFENRPRLTLAALPLQAVLMPTLFSTKDDPLVKEFENPPRFRDSGFDFAIVMRSAEITGNKSRRVTVPGYKSFQLFKDGGLVVLTPGDDDFLSWFSRNAPSDPLRSNSFVLAEVTYAFTKYAKALYQYAVPNPKQLRLYLCLNNMTVDGKPASRTSRETTPYGHMRTPSTDQVASLLMFCFDRCTFDETAERKAFLAVDGAGHNDVLFVAGSRNTSKLFSKCLIRP